MGFRNGLTRLFAGLALLLGVGIRIAVVSGIAMLLLMYSVQLPPEGGISREVAPENIFTMGDSDGKFQEFPIIM